MPRITTEGEEWLRIMAAGGHLKQGLVVVTSWNGELFEDQGNPIRPVSLTLLGPGIPAGEHHRGLFGVAQLPALLLGAMGQNPPDLSVSDQLFRMLEEN